MEPGFKEPGWMAMADAFQEVNNAGTKVGDRDGWTLFDYLEAAYGTDRAESLTIGVWSDLKKAGSLMFQITELKDSHILFSDTNGKIYDLANEAESLINKLEDDVIGEREEFSGDDQR